MTQAGELDLLRRRLYQPGADEQDLRSYESLRRHVNVDRDRMAPAVDRRRNVSTRRTIIAIGALLVAAASVEAALVHAVAPRHSTEHLRQDDVETVAVSVSVDGVATRALRFDGSGSARLPLRSLGEAPEDGRLVVDLAAAGGAAIGWQATTPERLAGGGTTVRTLASSPLTPRDPLGDPEISAYRGASPSHIVVQDDGHHRWSLTVALVAAHSATASCAAAASSAILRRCATAG